MSRAFVMLIMMIALGFANIALLEHRPVNSGLPLVRSAATIDDSWPPRRFQRDASAYVHFVALNRIDAACHVRHDPVNPEEACQQGNVLVLPNPCLFPRPEAFARLACHELAHINSWPENHPR